MLWKTWKLQILSENFKIRKVELLQTNPLKITTMQ